MTTKYIIFVYFWVPKTTILSKGPVAAEYSKSKLKKVQKYFERKRPKYVSFIFRSSFFCRSEKLQLLKVNYLAIILMFYPNFIQFKILKLEKVSMQNFVSWVVNLIFHFVSLHNFTTQVMNIFFLMSFVQELHNSKKSYLQ